MQNNRYLCSDLVFCFLPCHSSAPGELLTSKNLNVMCNLNNVKLFLKNLILGFRIFKIFINVKVFLHHVNQTNPTGCFCHCFTREQILISYAVSTQLLLYMRFMLIIETLPWSIILYNAVQLYFSSRTLLHCCIAAVPWVPCPLVPCWPGPSSAGNIWPTRELNSWQERMDRRWDYEGFTD